jgi:hypothetical protein
MKIIIVNHARKRALARGINLADVELAAANPDQTLEARPNAKGKARRMKHLKKIGSRQVCVLVEYRGAVRIVVTCYWKIP